MPFAGVFYLWKPFKQNAHYTVGESNRVKNLQKVNHDLYISQRDFKIEVKYLKNWISSAKTRAASKSWSVFQQDFDWLMDEIDADHCGKVAFVIGWFNCVDSFSQLIQLGKGRGAYPLVDERKKGVFSILRNRQTANIYKRLKNQIIIWLIRNSLLLPYPRNIMECIDVCLLVMKMINFISRCIIENGKFRIIIITMVYYV